MKLSVNNFDLWVFRATPKTEYLLLRTSQVKADRFFGGSRFWQIPTDVVLVHEEIEDAATRIIRSLGLDLKSLWAAEHTYTIYNRRRKEISIIPVFATEVSTTDNVNLDWEHSEFAWYEASACEALIRFRGLKDGLSSVREYVTECENPAQELRLI